MTQFENELLFYSSGHSYFLSCCLCLAELLDVLADFLLPELDFLGPDAQQVEQLDHDEDGRREDLEQVVQQSRLPF